MTSYTCCSVKFRNNNITLFAGQEKPSEEHWDLMPSSKGRQRKKNPRYSDYETEGTLVVKKKTRKSLRGGGRASKTPPAKAKNGAQQLTDGEKDTTDKTPPESDGKTSQETPKKLARAKRTPAKKAAAKKNAPTDGGLPAVEGGGVDTLQQENGTPKPKRKYTRKQPAQKSAPVAEPPTEEAQGGHPAEPEEEIEPGGRRRRGAAKA